MRPSRIVILGKEYKVSYVDSPSEVDLFKRQSLWGQIDYWTRTIRVYAADRIESDIFETLLHEIVHGVAQELNIACLKDEKNHDQLDVLAVGLADVLVRNGMVVLGGSIDEDTNG